MNLFPFKKNKHGGAALITGASIYLLSNILYGIVPFLLLPILTHYLEPSEYGEMAMFQTLLGFLGAFIGATYVDATNRKYFDEGISRDDLSEFIGSCIHLILISSIVIFAIFALFKEQMSAWLNLAPKYILLGVLTSACTTIISVRLGQWQVRDKAAKFGALQVSLSLTNMVLSLFFVVFLLKGADGRINAQVLSSVTLMIISVYFLAKDRLLNVFIWNKQYLKEILIFGVPLMPHLAGSFLLVSVDRFVINREIGLSETGIYMVAVQLTASMKIVFDAINRAYIPWLFKKLKTNIFLEKQKIVKQTYIWFFIILLGVGLGFLIGPTIVVFMAGDKYLQAGEVIRWLILGQGFHGMYLIMYNYAFFSKKTALLSLVTISSGILNLLLLFILVRVLGLEGASIAFAISMCVRFLLTWWVAQKCYPMPWFNFKYNHNV